MRTVADASWDKRPVTVSVGAATRSDRTPDPADLIAEADDALYRSKRAGRNRYTHRSGSLSAATARR